MHFIDMDDKYIQQLENVIKQMLTPLKDIPFNLVIEGISGYKVIPFDEKDEKDKKLLLKLIEIAKIAGDNINKTGIIRTRPNEVGNDIEPFVKKAITTLGYRSSTPLAKSGKKKAMGYPDIEFWDEWGRNNYLECKTFNIDNISTTQRSFYLSPSNDFKVTKDAHHFVISYEIFTYGRQGSQNIYKCKSWKILTIENLLIDVKYEFQSDNLRLYSKKHLLAEGRLD